MTESRSFPAIRGTQGGRVFYSANVSVGMLRSLLKEDESSPESRSQRALDTKHSNAIVRFILANLRG